MYKFYENQHATETIIAIPALGERKEMFEPLIKHLPQFHWLVFDLPGTHKEQLDQYSIENFCEYIVSTMKANQITQAHFIGNSIGAWIIQAFLTKYPNLVQSLTLLDGGHYFLGNANKDFQYTQLPSGIENFEDIKQAVYELTYSMPNLSEESYENFNTYILNNYILLDDGYAHHCDEMAYNALSKEVETIDYCCKSFSVPVLLIIAGATANDYSVEQANQFALKHPNATLKIIETGQHYLPLTNVEEVGRLLKNF